MNSIGRRGPTPPRQRRVRGWPKLDLSQLALNESPKQVRMVQEYGTLTYHYRVSGGEWIRVVRRIPL